MSLQVYINQIGAIRSEDAVKQKTDLDRICDEFGVQLTDPPVCLPGIEMLADCLNLTKKKLLEEMREYYFTNRYDVLKHCQSLLAEKGFSDVTSLEEYINSDDYCAEEVGLLCIAMMKSIQITILLRQNHWSTFPPPISIQHSQVILMYVGKGLFIFLKTSEESPPPMESQNELDPKVYTEHRSRKDEFLRPKTDEELHQLYTVDITSQAFIEALDLPLWRIPVTAKPRRRYLTAPAVLQRNPFNLEWTTKPHPKVKPIKIQRRKSKYNTRSGDNYQIIHSPKRRRNKLNPEKTKEPEEPQTKSPNPEKTEESDIPPRRTGKLKIKEHKLVITKNKKYICRTCRDDIEPSCDVRFESQRELNEHTTKEHGKIKCNFTGCTKEYSSVSGLQKHQKLHQSDGWLCHVCGKLCSHESDLNTHLKSHEGQRAHKCQGCNKAYVHFADLKRHATVHQKRKYYCDLCSYSSFQKHDRDDHVKSHQADRYVCKKCGMTYMHRNAHNEHAKKCYGFVPQKRQAFD